jgi:hypothetical protein
MIFVFSGIVSVSLFLVSLLKWCLPFPFFLLGTLLQAFLVCLLVAAFFWSIIYIFYEFKVKENRAFLPLIINAIAILILLYFPFVKVWLKINFMVMESARTEVVGLVESRRLISDDRSQISLPPAYWFTSDDGKIQLEGNSILFYTFRGIDNYAGFIYIPNNLAPQQGDIVFYGKAVEVAKFKDRWFWVSAT